MADVDGNEPVLANAEDQLVKACQGGDPAAAEALVEQFWDRVYAYSYRLTMNATDAEDIAQETFFRALSKIQGYKPSEKFKSWLLRIATNIFVDQKKSPQRRDVQIGDLQDRAKTTEDPDQVLSRQELFSALQDAIATLTKEQQIVVLLRGVEHMDYPEIAGILETKESTARWHMYEARRILREKLSRRFELESFADE
jgi:RNA polymerase sigma-70 factor (ECF subfamily)